MPAPKNRRRVREGQPAVRLCRAEYGDRSENTKQTTRRIEHNRGSLNGEMFSGNKCALVEKHKIVRPGRKSEQPGSGGTERLAQ